MSTVVTTLASEYRSVFGVEPEKNTLNCYIADEKADAGIKAGESRPYREWIAQYAEKHVAQADRAYFLRFADLESIRAALREEPSASHSYRSLRDSAERYEQLRFVAAPSAEAEAQEIGMAFRDVDRESREALSQKTNLSAALAEAEQPVDIRDLYVLVVDDNINSAKYTKTVLDKVGIRADMCTSGPDALRMIDLQYSKHQPYHLVLMDCNMPEMDGLEAAKAIRALDREDAKTIPIIALTANAFDEDIKYSLQAGMNAHLCKPVNAEQLFQVMCELILEADTEAKALHV